MTSEPMQSILDRLNGVQPNGNGYMARCPAHEDAKASLHISEGRDGRVLIKCHANCETSAVVDSIGLTMRDLMPPKPNRQRGGKFNTVAAYDYRSASGTLLYQACRLDPKDFRCRKPDGGGGWTWRNVFDGVERVPYGLPELLASNTDDVVFVAEGEKDCDRLASLGLVASCNVGGAGKWRREYNQHFAGRRVVILADNDDAGRTHAADVASHLLGIAASIKIIDLPDLPPKGDVSDWLDSGGTVEELRRLVAECPEWQPTEAEITETADDRIRIEVTANDHIVIAETIDALATDTAIYKRGGVLVHVVREKTDSDDDGIKRKAGTPRIREVSAGYLRERLSATCRFVKVRDTEDGPQDQQVSPPGYVVQGIHTRGFWEPLRYLGGIVETPVLRPDGTILDRPGWDDATGLLYEPGDVIPQVPANPTLADAMNARDLLLNVVQDFPFAQEAHRAAWLAGLLTVLARRAFTGPAPLFLIDANVRGSGKSLLTDLIANITTGRDMPRLSNPGDDDEARKRITALAMAGDPLVLIDNIATTLGSASLDAALTSTTWKDRKLGGNEMFEGSLRAVWFATGNNAVLLADTSRRVCHVRIESPLEAPEERDGFRIPNLLQHVRENRLELLTAGLTILRAYVVAGRPDKNLKPWGSFEGWSRLVRNCVVWLGLQDPGGTRRQLAEASDRDAAALRALFEGWNEIDPDGEGLTSSGLVKLLKDNDSKYDAVRGALQELCDTPKELTGRKVGNQLRRFKGRVIGERRLTCREGRGRQNFWRIESASGVCGESGESFSATPENIFHDETTVNTDKATAAECQTHTPHTPHSPPVESGDDINAEFVRAAAEELDPFDFCPEPLPDFPNNTALCSRCEDILDADGLCQTCKDW